MKQRSEAGGAGLVVITLLLGVITIVLAGTSVWAYMNYQDQKNNTDVIVAEAVEVAKKEQAERLEAEYAEREKLPSRQYSGPSDLGSVTFRYPKTWSVYVANTDNKLEAYLHPHSVPKVAPNQVYATRVLVEDRRYEDIVRTFESKVQSGDLKSSPVSINGFSGIRLDGKFTPERSGSAVLFKVRDKTLTVASDSTTFSKDFNDVVLKSLTFNP